MGIGPGASRPEGGKLQYYATALTEVTFHEYNAIIENIGNMEFAIYL